MDRDRFPKTVGFSNKQLAYPCPRDPYPVVARALIRDDSCSHNNNLSKHYFSLTDDLAIRVDL